MGKAKGVWGIDIGQCSLKALKLRNDGEGVQVEAFDIIEHAQILSQPDTDREAVIREGLEQFLSRNNVAGSTVLVAVPGQTSFTRFVKLPPVETKRIPNIVRFEAEQQIPFPIDEVVWRYQTFRDPDSPDVEVGIFAMKRTDINEMLEHFAAVAMDVDSVQMAPLALYNFMRHDEQVAEEGATLLADVGAGKTDLVVSDGARIWTRTIQIGGNNFTEALVRAFKLSFAKAEKLKRTAASSKYARQIFQAMRPVFADLVQEMQRSIGYYTSLHREARFTRVVGLGNGFRLPGLQKYLEQNLSIPVTRVDAYNKVSPPQANAAKFADNALSFAVAYGLAIQGLGEAMVNTNLLPGEIARRRLWRQKRPWLAGAAAAILLAVAGWAYGAYSDLSELREGEPNLRRAESTVSEVKRLRRDSQQLTSQINRSEQDILWYFQLDSHQSFWPSVHALLTDSIRQATAGPYQQLLWQYSQRPPGMSEEEFRARQKQILQDLLAVPRSQRKLIVVDSVLAEPITDVESYELDERGPSPGTPTPPGGGFGGTGAPVPMPGGPGMPPMPGRPGGPPTPGGFGGPAAAPTDGGQPGYRITLRGRTPLERREAWAMLQDLVRASRTAGAEHPAVGVTDKFNVEYIETERARSSSSGRRRNVPVPGGAVPFPGSRGPQVPGRTGGDGQEMIEEPDPLTGEEMVNDTRFEVTWVVTIEDDGVSLPGEESGGQTPSGR